MDAVKDEGMGGSHNGKGRYEGTETLKARSTKIRRSRSKRQAMQELAELTGMSLVRGAVSGRYYLE